jgi:hypothetical protein
MRARSTVVEDARETRRRSTAILSPLRVLCGREFDNPGRVLACTWVEADLCSACAPNAVPRWVHPSALAIEMDLEIAALLNDVTYDVAVVVANTRRAP